MAKYRLVDIVKGIDIIRYRGLTEINKKAIYLMVFDKAKEFIYKNARPLDAARWNYLFEGGSRDHVLKILAAYQNENGGFGNALEPDCWNPNSAPIQTWVATQIIKEAGLDAGAHPIVQGILNYLSSGKDFDGHTWSSSIPSNNDYPHAPWWGWEPGMEPSYNPTASLVGFILRYADRESACYALGCGLAKEAYSYFKTHYPLDSMHTVSCFVEMYTDIKEANIQGLLDLDEYSSILHRQIKQVVTYDIEKWKTDYVCKPSLFIGSKASEFYPDNKAIVDYECEFILNTQEPDGTWAITWSWPEYPEEWSISKNWWKSDWIIKYIKYIKAFKM